MKSTILKCITAVIIVMITADSSSSQRPEPKKTEIMGHTMYTLLKPGDIPAIFEPKFISVTEAEALYHPNEPIIVVSGGAEAKAYSIWHLDRHEIVNDYIDGTAITVTW